MQKGYLKTSKKIGMERKWRVEREGEWVSMDKDVRKNRIKGEWDKEGNAFTNLIPFARWGRRCLLLNSYETFGCHHWSQFEGKLVQVFDRKVSKICLSEGRMRGPGSCSQNLWEGSIYGVLQWSAEASDTVGLNPIWRENVGIDVSLTYDVSKLARNRILSYWSVMSFSM